MIRQPIVMEAVLGRLIFGLTPVPTNQVFTKNDKCFRNILYMLGVEGRIEEKRYANICFEVAAEYSFQGFDLLPTGGCVAVFDSRIWVCPTENGSDSGWSVEKFHFYDMFYSELNDILKTAPVVRSDIPDIEEVDLWWIDVTTEKLVEKEKYWRLRK
jgi:hypothetical protein